MNRNEQIAPVPKNWVPSDIPGVIRLPPLPDTPHVTQATNQASPPGVVALAFAMVGILALGVFFAGVAMLKWDARLSFVVAFIVAAIGSAWVLVVVNGDLVALSEVRRTNKIAAQWIATNGAAYGHYIALERLKEENRHAEESQRIQAQTVNQRWLDDMAWTKDTIHAMQRKLLSADSIAPPAPSYVPAKSDSAKVAVSEWLETLWDRNGAPTFKGNSPMPWTTVWRGESWCDDARNILLDSGIVASRNGGRYMRIIPNGIREARFLLRTHTESGSYSPTPPASQNGN